MFGRILMLEWPPFTVVFLRVALAALTLWLFLLITKHDFSRITSIAPQLFLMALLNNVIPFSLILIGQREIGSGLASVVNAMTPIWTLIIAHLATSDEKITAQKVLGIALGFCGVAVLVGTDLLAGLQSSAFAQIAVLGATVSYGFAAVYGKRFAKIDPISVSAGQLTASTLLMLPIAWLIEGDFSVLADPSAKLIGAILGISILCTAFAYALFFRVLASAGATTASLVTFMVPVSAISLGVIFLGETLKQSTIIGALIILTGLILIDGRLVKRLR